MFRIAKALFHDDDIPKIGSTFDLEVGSVTFTMGPDLTVELKAIDGYPVESIEPALLEDQLASKRAVILHDLEVKSQEEIN